MTQAKHVDSRLGDEPFMLAAIKCGGVSPVVSLSPVPTEEQSRKFMAIVEGFKYKWPLDVGESRIPIEAHVLMSVDYKPVFPLGFNWDGATLAIGGAVGHFGDTCKCDRLVGYGREGLGVHSEQLRAYDAATILEAPRSMRLALDAQLCVHVRLCGVENASVVMQVVVRAGSMV